MPLQTVTMVVTGRHMGDHHPGGGADRPAGAGGCGPHHRRRHLPVRLLQPSCSLAVLVGGAEVLAPLMHAPEHAFHQTVRCTSASAGRLPFIVAYNVLGSIFRGSATPGPLCSPLPSPASSISSGTCSWWPGSTWGRRAALATVAAQTVSVLVSLFLIRLRRVSALRFLPATPALPPGHYRR